MTTHRILPSDGLKDEVIAENARLIAAALYEACKALVDLQKHHDYTHEGCEMCAQVRAARQAIALWNAYVKEP